MNRLSKYLSFYGGDRAISIIREYGLTQDIVKVVAGAAGGPKWLILGAIDRFLFSEWFTKRSNLTYSANYNLDSANSNLHFVNSNFHSAKTDPLFLIGSSAGAWRFAAASQNNPVKALEKLSQSYIHQWYSIKPTLEEIDVECWKVLNGFIDDKSTNNNLTNNNLTNNNLTNNNLTNNNLINNNFINQNLHNSINQILNHPYCRLNFFSVRSKGCLVSSDNPITLTASIMVTAAANIFNRKNLKYFFDRVLFYHPSDKPPFYNMDSGDMLKVALTRENFKKALISSGSIPLVMPGVKDIPAAPIGVYRDGGTIDYHLDIPFLGQEHQNKEHQNKEHQNKEHQNKEHQNKEHQNKEHQNKDRENKIVLFPHYTDRIIPGWLDKHLPWRKPNLDNFNNVLLITPTKQFLEMLPGGKIPERQDFTLFKGKNSKRIQRWKIAVKYSEILGDELCKVIGSGKISEFIQPICHN